MRPSVILLLLLYFGDGRAKKASKEAARTPVKEPRNTQCEMLGRRYLRHCQCGLSDLGLLTAAFIGKPEQSASPVNYLEFDMMRRQLGLHLTEIKSVKRLVMEVLRKLDGVAEEQEKMSLRQHTDAGPTIVVPKQTCLPVQQKTCPGIMYVGHISCTDILLSGTNTSGIFTIYPRFYNSSFPVFCDMDTDGGGWTVIQRRINGSIKFFRPWKDYKEGFGDLEGEFWLGLDSIHALTRSFGSTLLRIQVESFEGQWHIAQYDGFKVANESENYRMTTGRFTYGSNVPDSFSYHDGANFSTFDRDNDGDEEVNCGKKSRGGWWYKGGMPGKNKCGLSNPNGLYHLGAYEGEENGIYWYFWRSDYLYSFRKVVMMVRPAHFYYAPSQGYRRPPQQYPYPYPSSYYPGPAPQPPPPYYPGPAPQQQPYPSYSNPAPAAQQPYPNPAPYPTGYDAASLNSAPSPTSSSQYYYQRYMQGDKGEK
ncbi:angiopoietin-related protein 6-like [Branchiostoma floridae]|uniref:Angiopoietin-related protein 6-like n=1 Tax=Branchiostoma floridae TaxID=7739 RepID=A0A9J7N944_BRAFL|nr:angiopoietin-related protein 6-like [Branchiostoma floridae]